MSDVRRRTRFARLGGGPFGHVCIIAAFYGLLGGCATTSFAPPNVDLATATSGTSGGWDVCRPKQVEPAVPIGRDSTSARQLVDNFILVYRCRAHAAADGRQVFEVPALLVGVGAATALAFGAGADVAIGGGAATALLTGGKNYYSPAVKADIYDSALDALLCIKSESVGVDALTIDKVEMVAKLASRVDPAVAASTGVTVSADDQYFGLIQNALFSVERILAKRLSKSGVFDAAGVVAEIKTVAKDVEDRKATAEKTAEAKAKTVVGATSGAGARLFQLTDATPDADTTRVEAAIVELAVLQPKLQQCVIRAKI
ncbi:MAG: hypothetical protein ACRYG4_25560 [Janthinobacterium lividum]